MKNIKLVLNNFDARISNISIKPKNINSKVIISSKMYDETTDKELAVKIQFCNVAAIDFRINFFDCMIGAEAFGLYCIDDEEFINSVVKGIFYRRKEIYLMEGSYNYDENDENDALNCFDLGGKFSEEINEYKAYIQNVDAGVYIIVAKDMQIKR